MSNNQDIYLVKKILQQKAELFLRYEQITEEIIDCDTSKLMECIEAREKLSHEIDKANEQLEKIYCQPQNQTIKQAALNQIYWGECPDELKEIFRLGQQLAAIISRIEIKNQRIISEIQTKKDMLLEKIKDQNTGVNTNAVKYYNSSTNIKNNLSLFDNKC